VRLPHPRSGEPESAHLKIPTATHQPVQSADLYHLVPVCHRARYQLLLALGLDYRSASTPSKRCINIIRQKLFWLNKFAQLRAAARVLPQAAQVQPLRQVVGGESEQQIEEKDSVEPAGGQQRKRAPAFRIPETAGQNFRFGCCMIWHSRRARPAEYRFPRRYTPV